MKAIWEVKDIFPGRRYSKPGIRDVWIIGYISDIDGPARYVSISTNDGLVTEPITKEQFAQSLTEHGYLPLELIRSDR